MMKYKIVHSGKITKAKYYVIQQLHAKLSVL